MSASVETLVEKSGQRSPTPEVWADSEFRRQLLRAIPRNYCRPTFVHAEVNDDDMIAQLPGDLDALVEELAQGKPKTWIVTGGPGSGKTSITAAAAAALLDLDMVPITLDWRMLAGHEEHQDLRTLMVAACPDGIPVQLWKSRVKHGRCVVIIDGLNEIARQYQQAPVWRFVKATVEGGHPYPVLATMRHFADEPRASLARPMHLLDLAPLTSSQIATYLQAVGLNPADVQRLRGHGSGDDMYSNPLLLSLLATILDPRSADRGSAGMPGSRGGLLQQTMRRARRTGRLSAGEIAIERSGLQLESVMVAAAACVFGRTGQAQVFSRREVERLLAAHWPEASERAAIIDAFLDTQMVVGVNGDVDHFQFAHPSFVDFGIALAYRGEELPAALKASDDLVLCLGDWVGLSADPDERARNLLVLLPRQVEEASAPSLDCVRLVDVVVANRGVLSEETRTLLWKRIGSAFTGPWWLQQAVMQALNQLPEWTIAEALELGLLSKRPGYLTSAIGPSLDIRSLDVRKVRQARRRVRNERSKNKLQERERAYALARRLGAGAGREEALRVLKAAIATAGPQQAGEILTAIMWIGTSSELPFCTAALVGDPMESIRAAAAEMLGSFGLQAAMDHLMESLIRDESALVRAACASALGSRRITVAVGVLASALSDRSEVVRASAARALGLMSDTRAVAPLVRSLRAEHDYAVLAAIAWALGELRDPTAAPDLILASTETSTQVRAEACRALGEIRDRTAVPALARRLTDADPLVRGNAAIALSQIGDRAATPHLIEALAHPDGHTRAIVAKALAQIRDPRGIEPLLVALADVDPFVRGAAALALGRFADRRIAARLSEIATHDVASAVRSSAISSLGRIGGPRDFPLLERVIRATTDGYWPRAVAVMAYSALTQETPKWFAEIADTLKSVADEEAQRLRGTIIFCVGQHCNIELVGWLESIARFDADVINRTSAMSALVRNGRATERFLAALIADFEKAIAVGRKLDLAVCIVAASEILRVSAESEKVALALLARLLDVILVRTETSVVVLAGAVNDNHRTDSQAMVRVLEFIDTKVAAHSAEHPSRSMIAAAIDRHRRQTEFEQTLADLRSDPALLVARFQASLGVSRPAASLPSDPDTREGNTLVDPSCDLLVVTVNAIETQIMREALSELCGPPALEHAAINSYWRYSRSGFPSVRLMRCGMGGSGVRGAYAQVGDAIRDLSPAAVVAAGVAWGRDAIKTPLGTVLVSTHVLDFERQRIGEDEAGRPAVIARGARSEASPRLMNRFLMTDYTATEVSIIDGPLLSGEKLIDNAAFKNSLLEMFPEAIGGEMEGVGIQSVCDRLSVDWLVVKGVCDFAENKGEDKTARQRLAATRAAEALCAVLSQGGFTRTG